MKLIILAAGKGSRLYPLTNTIPKPLIKILGKPIIEHNLENIINDKTKFDEIIFVIKYKGKEVMDYFGDSYKGIKISYKNQGEEDGTGATLKGMNIKDDILIINGDSIFDKKDLDEVIKYQGYCVLAKKVEETEKYGIFKTNKDYFIEKVIEKPNTFVGNLANLGIYKFSSKIFEYVENIKISPRGEYELTDALNEFALHHPLKAIESKGYFIDISYPWQILSANEILLSKLEKTLIKGKIEENVFIKGNIILEEGSLLKSGIYIEGNCYIGKNTSIGPNTYINGTNSIGNNCEIGSNNEIKNSYIGNNTKISSSSHISDSIVGNNIEIKGGFITGNTRNDDGNISVYIKGEFKDTGLKNFGCIIGDNYKNGVNFSSQPGEILEIKK